LFKALPVSKEIASDLDIDLAQHTVSSGFVFAPEVTAHYTDRIHLTKMVDDLYGHNPEQLNQSFHKSWEKVRTAPIQQLVVEQITHYLTTYGFEAFGIYDQDTVYVPNEQLDAPELEGDIRLVIIRGYTNDELKSKLLDLLGSGVALHEDTVKDALDVAVFVGLSEDELLLVKNKEVRAALYDCLGLVPSNPTEFLRFVVYRATGTTLLIKSPAALEEIRDSTSLALVRYFDIYEKEHGLQNLAQIFYRFKPIFLAMRTNTRMRQIVNRIRRLAVTNHKPMPKDYLNDVTATLARGDRIDAGELATALESANTFRKIRLAYALKFRTTHADAILYQVRNGRSWATDFSFHHQDLAALAYEQVLESVISDVRSNVEGKKVFIPKGIRYGLPATEKQFSGNMPSGTCVEVTGGMIAGVHWENVDHHRIDLDLALQSIDGKIGWDAGYCSQARDVLFSGDMTHAPFPKGASELFALTPEARGVWLMTVNYYNFNGSVPVPFKTVVAQSAPRSLTKNYTIDPNLMVAQAAGTMDVTQKVLGIIVSDDTSCRFYFSESNLGGGRSSTRTKHGEQARDFLMTRFMDTISLNDVLGGAGAELVDDPSTADIDLSVESVDKASIIAFVTK
jgi:hypothetical protein